MDYSKRSLTDPLFSSLNIDQIERNKLISHREQNRSKVGLFSDETPSGELVLGACLIKAKSYVLKMYSPPNQGFAPGQYTEKLVMKGAKISLLDLKYDFASEFLLGRKKMNILYNHVTIESRLHNINLRIGPKAVCNRQFVKRYLLNDNITSYSFGHYMIPIYQIIYKLLDDVVALVDL